MDLLGMLTGAGGGAAVQQLAQRFGIDESQAQSAIGALLPHVAQGFSKNIAQDGGMESLLGALSGGRHEGYLDDPARLASDDTVADGNGILGHIFGSKDMSRAVAQHASAQTGIGADVLKGMLPVVATMVMGALSKNAGGAAAAQAGPAGGGLMDVIGGLLGGGRQAPGGMLGSLLTSALDQNKDGSALDDILGKFLGRR